MVSKFCHKYFRTNVSLNRDIVNDKSDNINIAFQYTIKDQRIIRKEKIQFNSNKLIPKGYKKDLYSFVFLL